MFSLFVRRALARRPALNALTTVVGRQPTLSLSSATLPALVVTTRPRFFSLSAPILFPVTEKKTTKKPTTTAGRKKPTEKPAAKKKKTAGTASKSKTKTKTKKPVAKKKPAKKKVVVVKPKKKKAPKKVVLRVQTPRNTPRLRPPPRQMPAFGVFYQRMYPTLSPKPTNIKDAFLTVQQMWGALSETEKEAFRTEARDISAQRKLVYDKWRHGLSQTDVQMINKYRTGGTKPRTKLGRDHLATKRRPLNGFLRFIAEMRSTGQIDPNMAPEGSNKAHWYIKEAGVRWRAMSEEQKKVYQ